MKMNKLAAGALALALGLGAVAPSLADNAKPGKDFVEEFYNEKLAEANRFYQIRQDATKAVEAAKARVTAAEKAVKKAEEDYKNAKEEKSLPDLLKKYREAVATANQEKEQADQAAEGQAEDSDQAKAAAAAAVKLAEAKAELAKVEGMRERSKVLQYDSQNKLVEVAVQAGRVEAARKAIADNKDDSQKETLENDLNKEIAALDKLNAEHEKILEDLGKAIEKEEADRLSLKDDNKLSGKQQALVDLVKAKKELTEANGAYGRAVAYEKAAKEEFEVKYIALKDEASRGGAILAIEGNKIVVKPSVKSDKKEDRATLIKNLEAAKDKAQQAIGSANFLLKYAPKQVAKVKDVLMKQIADAEATIKEADKVLGTKTALIATAYASEEVSNDKIKEITDKLNNNAEAIENTIKGNEANQPEVEAEKPAEKPAEEKKENKPSKKAGSNVKTGIAGVAGVAGILAAASVAYAASKRD